MGGFGCMAVGLDGSVFTGAILCCEGALGNSSANQGRAGVYERLTDGESAPLPVSVLMDIGLLLDTCSA
jgi:hypothetical protein